MPELGSAMQMASAEAYIFHQGVRVRIMRWRMSGKGRMLKAYASFTFSGSLCSCLDFGE